MRLTPLHSVYRELNNSAEFQAYRGRHGIESADVLSVLGDDVAAQIGDRLAPMIRDKVVVEIGAGTGLLGVHLGKHAARVYCIEGNPYWSFMFIQHVIAQKPRNVSYLLGAAEEFDGVLHADIALFCTHTGIDRFQEIGGKFAPKVIDVYGEFFGRDPRQAEAAIAALREAGL